MATLKEKEVVQITEVVQLGEKLVIPEDLTVAKAIKLLERFEEAQNQTTTLTRTFDVFPMDGAMALQAVLSEKFGWIDHIPTPGFWGDTPPQMLTIFVGPGATTVVPWGRLALPILAGGYIDTGVARTTSGRIQFQLTATIKKRSEKFVSEILAAIGRYLAAHSIYKGQAIKLRLRDNNGDVIKMPQPDFIDTASIDVDAAVYPMDVTEQLDTSLYTPIKRQDDCRKNKIPIKRGIMLAGTFGVGKTLAASIASRHAVDHEITFIYCGIAKELAEVMEFARQYAPAVVFCEDIDRSVGGERSADMDELLNILDGVGSKGAEIITVLTTNDVESINPAMLRPGRIDTVIEIKKPDPDAVMKLIRLYGGINIDPDADLEEVGVILAGSIPAVVAEVVKRAKLAQLSLTPEGQKLGLISTKALMISAESMQSQLRLLEGNKPEPTPTFQLAIDQMVKSITDKITHDVNEIVNG